MTIKFTNIFHCKTLQNLPKLGSLVWIWRRYDATSNEKIPNAKIPNKKTPKIEKPKKSRMKKCRTKKSRNKKTPKRKNLEMQIYWTFKNLKKTPKSQNFDDFLGLFDLKKEKNPESLLHSTNYKQILKLFYVQTRQVILKLFDLT
jgi:hypothetical protein